MEEYLTVNELSARIKFSRKTLYNLIYKDVLKQGVHFVKPSPRKLLFKWSEIEKWVEDADVNQDNQ